MTAVYRLKGTAGTVTNQAWPLEGQVVIGSDAGALIQASGDAIAPRHAELTVTDGEIRLALLESGAELFLNGKPVEESLLASGDEIRIGGCRWMLQAPGLRPQKVLTEDAVKQRFNWVPWLVAAGLVGLGALAWWQEYLPF